LVLIKEKLANWPYRFYRPIASRRSADLQSVVRSCDTSYSAGCGVDRYNSDEKPRTLIHVADKTKHDEMLSE